MCYSKLTILKIPLFVFIGLLFSIGMIIPSFAHTTVHVEQYEIEAGWGIEPPVVGIRNDIVLKIIERGETEGSYKGITSVFKDVDATVFFGGASKKIDVNSSVVYSRIKRLVKRKLIERFTIDVNDAELGYEVKALIGINIDTKQRDNVIEQLFKIDGVREVAEVTGRFDILVTMYSKSLDQMHKMVSEKIGSVEGIQSSESFIEMKSRTKAMPYMPSNSGD